MLSDSRALIFVDQNDSMYFQGMDVKISKKKISKKKMSKKKCRKKMSKKNMSKQL